MSGSVSVEEPGGRRSGSDREVTRCEMGRPRPGWREAAAGMKGGGDGGEERASRESVLGRIGIGHGHGMTGPLGVGREEGHGEKHGRDFGKARSSSRFQ